MLPPIGQIWHIKDRRNVIKSEQLSEEQKKKKEEKYSSETQNVIGWSALPSLTLLDFLVCVCTSSMEGKMLLALPPCNFVF